MPDLTTRCPTCATTFRLAREQLEVANGMVRCGKCITVFDANEQWATAEADSKIEKTDRAEDAERLPVLTTLLHNEFGSSIDNSVDNSVDKQTGTGTSSEKAGRLFFKLLVIVLGALLLAAQYSYFFSRELSQVESWRPAINNFCHYLGCKIDPYRDLDKLAIRQFIVHSHPVQPGALTVDLIIENRAPFAQPYPSIAIRFEDLQNQLIARRTFSARQYLSENPNSLVLQSNSIPPSARSRVNFGLVDPGVTAVNYSVELTNE